MSTSTNNTNMKACFSLSSLHPDHSPGPNTSPGHAQRVDTQRLYHSLTKRPKRTWNENAGLESPMGSKDEFWAALQPNYNYLMGRQLIDSCCQELLANNSQHSQMDVTTAESSCNEISDFQPVIASSPISDVETELGGIKQWLNEAEERLGPGVTECRSVLGKETLPQGTPFALRKDAKMFEHKTLQQDIESRGKTLSGLLRLCQSSSPALGASGDCNPCELPPHRRARALKLAQRLEKRWQILYLKNLEWILHLEKSGADTPSSEAASDSSEDEPGVTPARKKRLLEVMSPDVCTKGEQLLDLESQMRFTQSGKSSMTNSAVYYYKHSTTEYSSEDEDDDTGWTFRLQRPQPAAPKSGHRSSSSSSSVSSSQPLSDRSAPSSTSSSSSSSEDLNASVATCIGNVVMRPKRSPQRVKRRPVSLPFSLMSPEAATATTPTAAAGKTCSETNLAVLARRKRTMRRSKRRLLMASQSSESEDRSAVVRSSSFSGTIYKSPSPRPDGCHSDPSSCHRLRRTSGRLAAVPHPVPVAEESGEPSWDNYQERYNSEAYSEDPLDAEAARRLLEFGDDYSRYLRDCSSPIRRETVGQDSDSEVEELRYVLKLSQESLAFTSQRLQLATTRFDSVVIEALGPDSIVSIGELAEMAATCRESRKCVELVISRIEQEAAGVADMQLIYELLEQWEDLEAKTQELQRASNLARDVAALRQSLFGVTGILGPKQDEHDSLRQSRLESRVSLQGKLEVIREQLNSLTGVKGQLCEMNSLIQRLATEDNGAITQQIKSVLRGQIGELFDLWELNNQRLSAELNRTQQHLAAWQELDRQLSMLRGCLLRDRENLLTRQKDDSGSLSDSGISDAGSDVLETRGQELMTLRALADQLPVNTRNDIVQELDAAEKELEQLRLYSSQKNLSVSGIVAATGGTGKEKHWPPRHWLKLVPLCVVTLVAVVCSFLQPPNCCEYIDSSGKYWELLKLQHGPPPV